MKERISFDVKTKIFLVCYASIVVFAVHSFLIETLFLITLALIQMLSGKGVLKVRLVVTYFVFVLLQFYVLPYSGGSLVMMISIFVVTFRKLFPCIMAGIILVNTTKVSHLLETLSKWRIPKAITISLAVTLRYLPAIKEELGYINDAMRIRNTRSGIGNPAKRITVKMECYYVPLLISATQVSEELSVAAITRGIENPSPRTIMMDSRMALQDYIILGLLFVFLVLSFIYK